MPAVDNVNRMNTARIALANIRIASTPDESVDLARAAIAEAGAHGFAECYVPGYRWPGAALPAPMRTLKWASIFAKVWSSGVLLLP